MERKLISYNSSYCFGLESPPVSYYQRRAEGNEILAGSQSGVLDWKYRKIISSVTINGNVERFSCPPIVVVKKFAYQRLVFGSE